jgi:hypothetical protein
LVRIKDLNRRGDAELQKAVGVFRRWTVRCSDFAPAEGTLTSAFSRCIVLEVAAIINKSKEAQKISMLTDERDTYFQQVRGLRSGASAVKSTRLLLLAAPIVALSLPRTFRHAGQGATGAAAI